LKIEVGTFELTELLYAVLGYCLGSIPFGLLLARAAGLGDVRAIGSGNIGATNVLRMGNKKIAALTLLCDVLKGFFPVWLAGRFGGEWAAIIAGFAAMTGHIFPVWLGFKGGKGVATGLGVIAGWAWPLAVGGALIWIAIFYWKRISSLAALVASGLLPIVAAAFANQGQFERFVWPVALLALVIWITHHQNIGRLLRGEEKPSSFSKKP
jgi:acyl phosphate:glycerol-3-phosphate acyltransferase